MFKNLSTGAIGIRANMTEGLDLAKNAGFEGLDLNIDEANNSHKNTLSNMLKTSGQRQVSPWADGDSV